MSTNNICFHREIRKLLRGYPLLSVTMKEIKKISSFTIYLAIGKKNNIF